VFGRPQTENAKNRSPSRDRHVERAREIKRPPPAQEPADRYSIMTNEHQPCSGNCRCSFTGNINVVWRPCLRHLIWVLMIVLLVWRLGISETLNLAPKWALPAGIGYLVPGAGECGLAPPPVSPPPHGQPPEIRRPQHPRPHQKMHAKAAPHPSQKCSCV